MRLSEEQKHVIREIMGFKKNELRIGGLAGTGKSTVIKHLAELLPRFAVCAYTGKAASVLRKKGIDRAQTIHSLIYKAYTDEKNQVRFSLSPSLDCEWIIVDEASMVSEAIYRDLKWFGKPMVFVGDHGQLEPIGDKFNLMDDPDLRLETIHRNAGGDRPLRPAHQDGLQAIKLADEGFGGKNKIRSPGQTHPVVEQG